METAHFFTRTWLSLPSRNQVWFYIPYYGMDDTEVTPGSQSARGTSLVLAKLFECGARKCIQLSADSVEWGARSESSHCTVI